MGAGGSYKCGKCGHKTGMLFPGQGMHAKYRYQQDILYLCPVCKKYNCIPVYCTLEEFEKISKSDFPWSSGMADVDQKEKDSIKRKLIKQSKEGIKCPKCHSSKIVEIIEDEEKGRSDLKCPKCDEIMVCDQYVLWD